MWGELTFSFWKQDIDTFAFKCPKFWGTTLDRAENSKAFFAGIVVAIVMKLFSSKQKNMD